MFYNPVIVAAVAGWAAAQVLKFLLYLVQNASVRLERLYGSGGMPSSHSSMVCAAFICAGRVAGWTSPVAAVMFVVAAITMYDAANVRLEAGKHAKQLNEIMKQLLAQGATSDTKKEEFKELLGHTPLQVVCGAVLGIVIGAVIPV